MVLNEPDKSRALFSSIYGRSPKKRLKSVDRIVSQPDKQHYSGMNYPKYPRLSLVVCGTRDKINSCGSLVAHSASLVLDAPHSFTGTQGRNQPWFACNCEIGSFA